MTERAHRPISVTVVIPTHNRPSKLPIAVRSVLDQQAGAGVVIRPVVVDEASEPAAGATLGELAERVILIRNESPRGPAAARNQGAEAVPADYVAFLDDDDRWLPGKIRACLDAFATHPDAALVYHRVGFEDDEVPASPTVAVVSDPVARMLHYQPPHIDGVMVPARIHHAVEFDETFRAAEDLDYLLRVATTGPVVEVGAILAIHSVTTDEGSAISVERRIDGRRRFREKHAEVFDRAARAHSDLRIGHQYRRLGRPWAAAGAFAASVMRRPLWASPWKGLLGLALPAAMVQRFARTRHRRSTPVV